MVSISFVRLTGIEPARLSALDPKSSTSANSATGALLLCGCKGNNFYQERCIFFEKSLHNVRK